ncbi:MAG: glycosyltransferase family 2 protein [Planctomycetia bacterium]|nr:glycosyltransferase family 2 protein [Planctomycetia bacterium]
MSKPAAQRDGVTVVIPAHNAAGVLERVLPAWGAVLTNVNRPFEILVVNDGSTDTTATTLEKLVARVPKLRVLTHPTRQGFGACLRTALEATTQPLFFYSGLDYPYTPSDIKPMLERIELRDEIFGKQPDLISGFRAGQPRPTLVIGVSWVWKVFWRIVTGLPFAHTPPWYSWSEWWYKKRVEWVFGVPLADVNSAFKLYRTDFLKRFPIQSDGDFVHTELVAKATFLTSIMDELPLTIPRGLDLIPPIGPVSADRRKVFRCPVFAFEPETKPPESSSAPQQAEANTGGLASPGSPVSTS